MQAFSLYEQQPEKKLVITASRGLRARDHLQDRATGAALEEQVEGSIRDLLTPVTPHSAWFLPVSLLRVGLCSLKILMLSPNPQDLRM